MRIRLPLGRGLYFAVAFGVSALALLPLRLTADWLQLGGTGVAARDAAGSVWGGALHGAQYRDTQLGDLSAALRALPLLAGRARIELDREDAAPPNRLRAAVTVSRSGYGVDDATLRLPLGVEFAPLPITAIDLSNVSARFAAGQCASAAGAVTVETSGSVAGLPIPASMTGNARCDGNALLLPLAGATGLEQLELRFGPGDRYRAALSVRPTDPVIGQRLATAGFVNAAGVYSLSLDGRLR